MHSVYNEYQQDIEIKSLGALRAEIFIDSIISGGHFGIPGGRHKCSLSFFLYTLHCPLARIMCRWIASCCHGTKFNGKRKEQMKVLKGHVLKLKNRLKTDFVDLMFLWSRDRTATLN